MSKASTSCINSSVPMYRSSTRRMTGTGFHQKTHNAPCFGEKSVAYNHINDSDRSLREIIQEVALLGLWRATISRSAVRLSIPPKTCRQCKGISFSATSCSRLSKVQKGILSRRADISRCTSMYPSPFPISPFFSINCITSSSSARDVVGRS